MFTMLLSGLHRITGMALSVGLLLMAWWLMALAAGPDAYARAVSVLRMPLFRVLLAGFMLSLIYHFCNGIRHMTWDTGRGLERAQSRRSGQVVVVATLVLFGLSIWVIW